MAKGQGAPPPLRQGLHATGHQNDWGKTPIPCVTEGAVGSGGCGGLRHSQATSQLIHSLHQRCVDRRLLRHGLVSARLTPSEYVGSLLAFVEPLVCVLGQAADQSL